MFVLLWSGPVSGQEISVFKSTNDYGEALVRLFHPVIKSISKEGENTYFVVLSKSIYTGLQHLLQISISADQRG